MLCPAVDHPWTLGAAALVFNTQNAQTQLSIAEDSQHEAALQDYIDDMSALLLDKDLRTSAAAAEVRTVARTRTVSVQITISQVGLLLRPVARV